MQLAPLALVVVTCAVAACSGGAGAADGSWGVPRDASTRAVLVGPLCADGEPCECRDPRAPGLGMTPDGAALGEPGEDDGDAEAAAVAAQVSPEAKRLEIRLRSSHDLWLRIGEWTFYKDRERAEACYYIDVPAPGVGERAHVHQVELRDSNPDGVSAELELSELGVAARTWYRTFRFSCGVPGACSFDELDALKAAAKRAVASHTLYDACGSLRVNNVRWDGKAAPDHPYPGELKVSFELEVFHFTPDKPHGDPRCAGR